MYFKIDPKGMEIYFTNIMTAMLSLTQLEYYSKFNGKNLGGIRVPMLKNISNFSTF